MEHPTSGASSALTAEQIARAAANREAAIAKREAAIAEREAFRVAGLEDGLEWPNEGDTPVTNGDADVPSCVAEARRANIDEDQAEEQARKRRRDEAWDQARNVASATPVAIDDYCLNERIADLSRMLQTTEIRNELMELEIEQRKREKSRGMTLRAELDQLNEDKNCARPQPFNDLVELQRVLRKDSLMFAPSQYQFDKTFTPIAMPGGVRLERFAAPPFMKLPCPTEQSTTYEEIREYVTTENVSRDKIKRANIWFLIAVVASDRASADALVDTMNAAIAADGCKSCFSALRRGATMCILYLKGSNAASTFLDALPTGATLLRLGLGDGRAADDIRKLEVL